MQTEAKPSFEIGDQKIKMITDIKYLGVQIDDKLQWDRHIEHVKAKALRALGLIKHTKKNFFHQVICRKCIDEFLSHISVIAARFGVVVVKPNLILSKRSRTELQE